MSERQNTEAELGRFLDALTEALATHGADSPQVQALLTQVEAKNNEWHDMARAAVELRRTAEQEGRVGARGKSTGRAASSPAKPARENATLLAIGFVGLILGVTLLSILNFAGVLSLQPPVSSQQISGDVAKSLKADMKTEVNAAIANSKALSDLPDTVGKEIKNRLKTEVEAAIKDSPSLQNLPKETAKLLQDEVGREVAEALSKSETLKSLPATISSAVSEKVKAEVGTAIAKSLDMKKLADDIAQRVKGELKEEIADAVAKSPALADLPKQIAKEFDDRVKRDLIREIRLAVLDELQREASPILDRRPPIRRVAFSPTGKQALSINLDGTATLWELDKGSRTITYPTEKAPYSCASFSPDGRQALLGSRDGKVQRIEVSEAKVAEKPKVVGQQQGQVYCVAFSSESRLAASGGEDGKVYLWNPFFEGEKPRLLEGHRGGVWSVGFSPKGDHLVSGGSDKVVRVWATNTPKEVYSFEGHQAGVREVAFAVGDQRVISVGADRTARLWELGMRKEVKRFESSGFSRLAVTPDGEAFAVGSGDNSIQVWGTRNGEKLQTFTGTEGIAIGLEFVRDRDTPKLLSAGPDGTIRAWNLRSGKEESKLTLQVPPGKPSPE